MYPQSSPQLATGGPQSRDGSVTKIRWIQTETWPSQNRDPSKARSAVQQPEC
jgi:hypothetical protein